MVTQLIMMPSCQCAAFSLSVLTDTLTLTLTLWFHDSLALSDRLSKPPRLV